MNSKINDDILFLLSFSLGSKLCTDLPEYFRVESVRLVLDPSSSNFTKARALSEAFDWRLEELYGGRSFYIDWANEYNNLLERKPISKMAESQLILYIAIHDNQISANHPCPS